VDHRLATCATRTLCQEGERVQDQGDDGNDRVCVTCQGDTYQPAQDHRLEVCTDRDLCKLGEFVVSQGSLSTNRVCTECAEGECENI
jgi:hypothetical protein